MNGTLEEVVARHRERGALLDSNVLLLYLIGRFDRERITRFKRTVQFTPSDFDLLAKLLAPFERIRTLPHILAEVNSLSSQLPAGVVERFRTLFRDEIALLAEGQIDSTVAVDEPEIQYLGLTDAAILADDPSRFLVITVDLRLYAALSRRGADVINLNSLRFG